MSDGRSRDGFAVEDTGGTGGAGVAQLDLDLAASEERKTALLAQLRNVGIEGTAAALVLLIDSAGEPAAWRGENVSVLRCSQREIARRLGVSASTVGRVVDRLTSEKTNILATFRDSVTAAATLVVHWPTVYNLDAVKRPTIDSIELFKKPVDGVGRLHHSAPAAARPAHIPLKLNKKNTLKQNIENIRIAEEEPEEEPEEEDRGISAARAGWDGLTDAAIEEAVTSGRLDLPRALFRASLAQGRPGLCDDPAAKKKFLAMFHHCATTKLGGAWAKRENGRCVIFGGAVKKGEYHRVTAASRVWAAEKLRSSCPTGAGVGTIGERVENSQLRAMIAARKQN